MILVQEIVNRSLAVLDSENSDRYLFDQDFKPAINGAVETLVTWLNQAFAEKKLTPENLRELTKVKVWQANSYSRVAFNEAEVGHALWTLLAIYPKPQITVSGAVISASATNSVSTFRPDISFIRSLQSAKRLNFEEWNENQDNPFMPGNNILAGSIAEYAYLDAADYTSTTYPGGADHVEWTIRPDIPNQYVAIAYIKYPTPVTQISDSLEFPKSVTDLLTDLCVNKLSYKQPTQSLYAATTQGINKLVALIKNG